MVVNVAGEVDAVDDVLGTAAAVSVAFDVYSSSALWEELGKVGESCSPSIVARPADDEGRPSYSSSLRCKKKEKERHAVLETILRRPCYCGKFE